MSFRGSLGEPWESPGLNDRLQKEIAAGVTQASTPSQ